MIQLLPHHQPLKMPELIEESKQGIRVLLFHTHGSVCPLYFQTTIPVSMKKKDWGSEQSPQSPAPLYNVYFFLTVPDLFFRSSLLFNLEVWKNHSGYHQWNMQPLAV